MLKSPQGSPRKTREKIATKTGVEKIMTELKCTIRQFNQHTQGQSLTCRQVACSEMRKTTAWAQQCQRYIAAGEFSACPRGKHFHFCRWHTKRTAIKLPGICKNERLNWKSLEPEILKPTWTVKALPATRWSETWQSPSTSYKREQLSRHDETKNK